MNDIGGGGFGGTGGGGGSGGYNPPDMSTRPSQPPPGSDPSSGNWLWNGSSWKWTPSTGNSVGAGAFGAGGSGTSEGTTGGGVMSKQQQDVANQVSVNTANDQAVDHYLAQNQNPYGDQYQSNLHYTPFGLNPYQGQQGQYGLPSAFGGLSFNSDLLVPQMEQQRMQRIMQTYTPYGGK